MSDFYIMNASCLTDGKKTTVADVVKNNSTILVCKRHRSDWGDKTTDIWVRGSGGYGVKVGDNKSYTQDTGNGYRCQGYRLEIENVITVDKHGKVESELPYPSGKRQLWVMK